MMKSKLFAVTMAAMIAGALAGCTRDYMDNKEIGSGAILRPGGAPTSPDERVAPNDSTAGAAKGLAPSGPAGPPSRAIDPDAPKQSNGGAGTEYGSGFSFDSAKTPAAAR